MQFWIGVEKFAKIESAKISIDNYTVLVGPNNSGKTFLMQLVQGVSKKLATMIDESIMTSLLATETDAYKEYNLNADNISVLVECINKNLALEKEKIVREIFGRDISIEKIYVEAVMEEKISYSLCILNADKRNEVSNMDYIVGEGNLLTVELLNRMEEGIVGSIYIKEADGEEKRVATHYHFTNDKMVMFKYMLHSMICPDSLFMPASRTGLLLLYREFFANRTDKDISFVVRENEVIENREKFAELPQPMYEFLRFLQTYTESDEKRKLYGDELVFFEKHLIEGQIRVDKQGVFSYFAQDDNNEVPMYLTSSMIKEVAPIVLAITSRNSYKRLIIDEIEASLHPQKQMELVRFLNRLNNKGMRLIVSTHSDTFASKLSNLYVLSEAVRTNGEKILERFNLEKEDLIDPKKIFVYEFVIQPNGKSVVREIMGDKKNGFQFDAFTDSALHLYEEGIKLGEIQ